MKSKIYKEFVILLLLFVGAWIAIALLRPEPDIPDMAIDPDTEVDIGDVLAEHYIQEFPLEDNDSLQAVIDSVAVRLISNQTDPDFDIDLHLIASDDINAFATMGGHIFVHQALVEFCESPEELAAVIAHEMGHVEHRHVMNRMISELGMTLLLSIGTGGDPAVLTEIARYGLSNTFSRNDEREADDFGLELLEESGIHPVNMASVFRRMKEENTNGLADFDILSTHPSFEERIRRALEYDIQEDFEEVPYTIGWH